MIKRYPFKFLDAYNKADTDIFFGRDEEVEALYQMAFQSDILLVYGASGTGKTSLINCGLASRFQAHDWLALNIRRGSDINVSLQQKLDEATAGARAADSDLDLSWLDEEEEETTGSPLSRQIQEIYRRYFRPVYLIFDQLEELYILGSKAEQAQFIRNVQEIQSVDQPVKMIFVIREEYLGHLFEFERAVPQLLRKKLRVEPMNLDKVGQVVRGAAALDNSNVRLEAGQEAAIVEGIFGKIRGDEQTLAIQLPYLQVFLDKLYLQVTGDESRRADALFTARALAKIGGIGDVLRDFLEEQAVRIQQSLRSQYPNLPKDAVWQLLSPLATLEGTKEPMLEETLLQRLAHLSAAAVRDGLRALDQSRILRYDEQEGRYEVAHDSLAARIAERRNDDEIALLEIRRLITSQMALKAEARAFFTEKQLNLIEPYVDQLGLEPEAVQLIEDSRKWVEAIARKKRWRNVIIGGVLAAATIVSVFFAFRANIALENAEEARREAEHSDSLAQDARDRLLAATEGIVLEVLAETEDDLYHLRQRQALAKFDLLEQTELTPAADSLWKKGMLELAFFFNEIAGNSPARRDTAYTIARKLAEKVSVDGPADKTSASITRVLKEIDPAWYDSLTRRYYPQMVTVEENDQIADFEMGQTEVTMWQYQLYCEATKADSMSRIRAKVPWGLDGDNPVVLMSWYDAARYANWMSKRAGLDTVYAFGNDGSFDSILTGVKGSYRLPTNEQWKYAARGGPNQQKFTYSGSNNLGAVAWYRDNSGNRTHPVAQKKPISEDLKVYDMTGNVWEWCENADERESKQVFRGGSWYSSESDCRVSNIKYRVPSPRSIDFGFRLVRHLLSND